MISDDDVRKLYLHAKNLIAKKGNFYNTASSPHLFRGDALQGWDDAHPGGCPRHMATFNNFGIIPKHCFDCYKVIIEPQNIVELFKLVLVFINLKLPNDNTRKTFIELRPKITGNYKGFIYCKSVDEARQVIDITIAALAEKTSNKMPLTIKRGCSEYALTFPEYADITQSPPSMQYKPEWSTTEDTADKALRLNANKPDKEAFNHPTCTLNDADTLHYYLRYASSIGDMNYLRISGENIAPLPNVNRKANDIDVDSLVVTMPTKIGRNESCVCGSEKKYKHCCGLN